MNDHALPKIFMNLDGTGRKPRTQQVRFLNWMYESKAQIKVGILPVALGKSFIAKTLQKSIKASVITCNNVLVDQYAADYPLDNILKGQARYDCRTYVGVSCETANECFDGCENCPYVDNRDRAKQGESTVFNPMSLYSLTNSKNSGFATARPPLTIVDEAHQLPGMLRLLSSASFCNKDYALPEDITNYSKVLEWLRSSEASLKDLMSRTKNAPKEYAKLEDEARKFRHVIHGYVEDQSNYAVYIETKGRYKYLTMTPIKVVKSVADRVLGKSHILFMSGTLFKTDIEELIGNSKFDMFEAPSPIPKENRPIYFEPASFRMNYQTDPTQIALLIEQKIAQFPDVNTVIHVSYALSKRLQPHLKIPFICNTAENKMEKLAYFKKHGGIFLASGCSEGIDLADDLCRLNIIPQLLFPALNDPIVIKRKALEDGDLWYRLETLKTVIQQYGRSTRHEKDWSNTFILDPMMGSLFMRTKDHLPKYFREAFIWPKK